MNTICLGLTSGTVAVGQNNGVVSIVKVNGGAMQKLGDYQVTDRNVSKLFKTSRSDLAVATSKGLVFGVAGPGGSIVPSSERLLLHDQDITELSEYVPD